MLFSKFKYSTLLYILLFSVLCLSAQSQDFNNVDSGGNRIGKWIFYLDVDLNPVPETDSYSYYKVVNYVSGRPIGYVNYYYRSGRLYFQTPVKSIDPDIYVDGEIRFFSETGERIRILNYQNGMLNGPAIYYYEDGSPQMQGMYTDDVKTGLWKQWDSDASYGIGEFLDDIPDGRWTFYYPDGSIRSEGKFYNGLQSGVWIEYRETGEIAEGTYANGLPEGTWVCRYRNEKPCFMGSFKKGMKDGFWQEWDAQGRLSRGNYVDDLKDGIWTMYNAQGRKIMEGNFILGKEDGRWIKYDNMGNIIESLFYRDGVVVRQ